MASNDQVEARVQYPRLGAGKYKIEAIVVPSLPSRIAVDGECVVLSCEMVRLPDRSQRLTGPHGHAVTVTDKSFGLVVVIATPEREYCQCVDMPPHDSGFCPQCGRPEL